MVFKQFRVIRPVRFWALGSRRAPHAKAITVPGLPQPLTLNPKPSSTLHPKPLKGLSWWVFSGACWGAVGGPG